MAAPGVGIPAVEGTADAAEVAAPACAQGWVKPIGP
jgi:hypothetical protein